MRAWLLAALAAILAGCSFSSPVQLSAEQVEARAAEILPGAAPVGALKGVLYVDVEDAEAAVLAADLAELSPSALKGDSLRIVVGRPKVTWGEEESAERIQALIERQRERKEDQMKKLSQEVEIMDGRPVVVTRYELLSDGRQLQQWSSVFPRRTGLAVVLVLGPADSFNAGLAGRFLAGIQPARPAAAETGRSRPGERRGAKPRDRR
ncbi:MAG: hypothetical protein HY319_06735 [Armatimonadetes bacterium]|nr:hypothetical protein [Armatimonadota bacterium]